MFAQLTTSRIEMPCFPGVYTSIGFASGVYGGTFWKVSAGLYVLTRRAIGVVSATQFIGRSGQSHTNAIPGSVVPITSRWCKESHGDMGADESPQGTRVRPRIDPDRKGPSVCPELGCFGAIHEQQTSIDRCHKRSVSCAASALTGFEIALRLLARGSRLLRGRRLQGVQSACRRNAALIGFQCTSCEKP